MPMAVSAHSTDRKGLLLIAAFKYVKAVSLVVIGLGILHFMHRDLADEIVRWAHKLHINPENRYLLRVIDKMGTVGPHRMAAFAAGTFAYSALLFTEGTGLFLEKRWGEYLTIVATGVFLPWEIWEVVLHFTSVRMAVLLVNLGIVAYLVWVVRKTKPAK